MIYDDSTGIGHYVDFLPGLVRAAVDAGDDVIAAAPEAPSDLASHPRVQWVSVPELTGLPRGDRAAYHQRLKGLKAVDAALGGSRADLLIDLDFMRHFSVARRYRHLARRWVMVVHAYRTIVTRPLFRADSQLVSPTVWGITRASVAGGCLAPHTRSLKDRLDRETLWTSASVVPLFVPSVSPRTQPAQLSEGPLRLVFVGGVRERKGFDVLRRALERWDSPAVLEVVGRQAPEVPKPVRIGSTEVSWRDEFLPRDELVAAIKSSHLAVLAHTDRFAREGAASGSLLDVLGTGTPAIVSSSLEDQLPPGAGAMVFKSEQAQDLIRALRTATEQYDTLARDALANGPDVVARSHSSEAYYRSVCLAAGIS